MLQSWNGDLAAFRAVLGAARMPTILADATQPDHPIVFANQAFLDLTGYAREEVLGRNCRFLQGAETDQEALIRLRDALAQAQPISVDVVNYRADGSRFWNTLFIGPVFDDGGVLRYFLGNQLDVTSQKAAEEALHQKRKVEAVGRLATGLAHVLTNLLQVVSGALELMAPKFHEAGIARHGARALHAARDAAELVHQVLAFARKAPLSPRPLDLTETIQSMRRLLEASVAGRGLRLTFNSASRRVLLDRTEFEAAMLSLMANAREATSEQGQIVVRVQNDDLGGAPAVAVWVEDNGQGMTAEVLNRAAEPFFTTKLSARNTGMGLSVISGFVAQSKGRLDLQSEVGRGARVTMVFPATLTQVSDEFATPSGARGS